MKIILYIVLLFFSSNLFAQEKHSDLYYKVDSICKASVKPLNDTINSSKIKLNNEVKREYRNVLLIIDGVQREFKILDSMNLNLISSIILLPNNINSCRPIENIISIQTKEVIEQQNNKNKKRKLKNQ